MLLFLNTSAGISLISQKAPVFQEVAGVSASVAAEMVGIASIGNAVGRVFWAWVSDIISRRTTVTFVILMCYGGGFGTMPALTADYFGPRNVGPIYGLMLTAWSFASVFGPLLIARMRNHRGVQALPGLSWMQPRPDP